MISAICLRRSGPTAARRSSLKNPSIRKYPAVGSGPNGGGGRNPDSRPATNPIKSRLRTSETTRPTRSQRLVRIGIAVVVREREEAHVRDEFVTHAARIE